MLHVWCCIIVLDGTSDEVDTKLEMWRQLIESKGFEPNWNKTRYMELFIGTTYDHTGYGAPSKLLFQVLDFVSQNRRYWSRCKAYDLVWVAQIGNWN